MGMGSASLFYLQTSYNNMLIATKPATLTQPLNPSAPILSPSSPPLSPSPPLTPSTKTQLPIKSLAARLPPQKPLQCLHLLLAPALLKHLMPVPSSLLGIHGILSEDAVEHVGAVDLAAEVAVVAGVVAAD